MAVCIVVFKSKTDVFDYLDYLRRSGVPCSTTGTPKEAGVGCGLAVRLPKNYLDIAQKILSHISFPSFHGIYSIVKSGERTSISRIV